MNILRKSVYPLVVILSTAVSVSAGPSLKKSTLSKLGLPSSGTVFTLMGLNMSHENNMPEKFKGVFSRPPYKMVMVDYPASFDTNSIPDGVKMLDAALKATPGKKIVMCHSQGAQVASRWMREHAKDPAAPRPGELTFLLSGNPLRSDGGGDIVGRTEVGGTIGVPTPTDTPWHIVDVARRYDGWADRPADPDNSIAEWNATVGKFSLHMKYSEVNLNDPDHTIWTKANTTYVLTQEETLPMWQWSPNVPAEVVSVMKAHVESAYRRPPNDPPVKPLPVTSRYWQMRLKNWGVANESTRRR